jgi:hypothetical protein
MDAGLIDRIETNVERAASALFGGAAGFSAYRLLSGSVPQTELVVWTVAALALATLLSRRVLVAAGTGKPRFSVTVFDVRELEPFEADELLLTNAERVGSAELVLTKADECHPGELLLTEADRCEPGELLLTEADRREAGELLLTEADRREAGELLLTEADRREAGELLLTEADRRHPGELLLTEADRREPGELLLTASDRLHPAPGEPLVLDDIVAELGPDARVVRLFDRKAMPTPGQLKSRIDSHLEQGSTPPASTDAAKALSDALAELRRSLR